MAPSKVLEAASKQEPVEVTKGNEKGTLRVDLTIREYNKSYDSCKKFDVKIQQKLRDADNFTEIGYMVGFIVEQDHKSDKKGSAPLWIPELLHREWKNGGDTQELHRMCQFIWTKAGNVRARFKDVSAQLSSSDTLVFIDTLKLHRKHMVSGAGRQPRIILEILPQVVNDDEEVPCILRPCFSNGTNVNNDYTAKEIEEKLMSSYEKNGFEVWFQKSHDKDDEISVMGRLLEPIPSVDEE